MERNDLAKALDYLLDVGKPDEAMDLALSWPKTLAQEIIEGLRRQNLAALTDATQRGRELAAPFLPVDWFNDREDELAEIRRAVDDA